MRSCVELKPVPRDSPTSSCVRVPLARLWLFCLVVGCGGSAQPTPKSTAEWFIHSDVGYDVTCTAVGRNRDRQVWRCVGGDRDSAEILGHTDPSTTLRLYVRDGREESTVVDDVLVRAAAVS